jgi:hypothetical protein
MRRLRPTRMQPDMHMRGAQHRLLRDTYTVRHRFLGMYLLILQPSARTPASGETLRTAQREQHSGLAQRQRESSTSYDRSHKRCQLYSCIHARVCACMYVCMHACIYVYVHTYIHAYIVTIHARNTHA